VSATQNYAQHRSPAHPSQAQMARDSGSTHGRQSCHRAAENIFNPPKGEKRRDSPHLLQELYEKLCPGFTLERYGMIWLLRMLLL